MGRRSKFDQETKLEVVREYLEGKASSYDLARKCGCDSDAVLHWVAQYESHGAEALRAITKNQSYTSEFKQLVVDEYLRGEIGLRPLAVKHHIRNKTQIMRWISLYNGHKKLKSSGTSGGIDVTNGRKTTYEERIEIVEDCLKTVRTTPPRRRSIRSPISRFIAGFRSTTPEALQR